MKCCEMMYGMGDLTGVSVTLGVEIFSGGKKCRKSNIGDSDNTGDGGKIVGEAIRACGGIGNSLSVASCACMTFIYGHHKKDLIKKAEEKLSLICAERVMLEDYMRKASLKCPGDRNGDEEDVNEGDKDPNGINPSFGFSKISLEDLGNDRGPAKKHKFVEGNPTEQGNVVEGNQAEQCEIMSTPENFTQWFDKNVNLVGEVIDSINAEYIYGDLFGDNSVTLEAMNQEITPEKLPIQKASPNPKKEL
ncbi:hypothetical protein Tco_0367412 [Tanacetum coccineum]